MIFKKNKKKGELLIENVIFIILNVIFLTILILFLTQQGSGAKLLEKTHSKQIALLVDSSQPIMKIKINMEKAMEAAKENEFDFSKAVKISDNVVHVQLDAKGGLSYSFFNDVKADAFPEKIEGEHTGNYVITINKK